MLASSSDIACGVDSLQFQFICCAGFAAINLHIHAKNFFIFVNRFIGISSYARGLITELTGKISTEKYEYHEVTSRTSRK